MKPVLLDTGVVVALLDRSERYHAHCVAVLAELEQPLVTCEAVITESCYLLRRLTGACETILDNIAKGAFLVPFQLSESAPALRATMRKYSDLPADFADACLIQLAEQLHTGDILTLDRDFELYRWSRSQRFHLLIDLK